MPKDFRHTSGALEDDYFYGRKEEMELLHANIDLRQHTALIGQRQFGKTALILKAIEKHPEQPLLGHLDLTRKATLGEAGRVLLDTFMHKNFGFKRFIVMARTDPQSIFSKVINVASKVKKIKLSQFEIEIKEVAALATMEDGNKSIDFFVSVIELIDSIAIKTEKKAVIFIDEFQRIIDFPEVKNKDNDIMWPFRSAIQDSKNTTLIVAGSKPSVVKKIILEPDGAFFQGFVIEDIHGIAKEDFLNHFNEVCKTYSVENLPEVTQYIFKVCGGIPSYLSLFGRKLFDDARRKKKLTQEMYFLALEKMFKELNPTLRLQEERLSEIQYALVVYKDIFVNENPIARAAKISGTTKPNIQNNTIGKLEDFGYIVKTGRGKYDIVDKVLGYYLAEILHQEQFETLYKDEILLSML